MSLKSVVSANVAKEEIPEIVGYRRAHHADIPRICQMMTAKNSDLFGDVEPGQLYERACLSLVQINEKQEIVSNISLCNFPNVPAIPTSEWLSWITMHYELPGVIEKNTLFVHLLVWDCRYDDTFFKALLESIFAIASYCFYVIIVMPPGIAKGEIEIFQEYMMRVAPKNVSTCYKVQTLFVGLRQRYYPKLQIRRVVEEDNDDLIPIIDEESKRIRAMYGEFYISEMMRYPGEGNRQLIVAESEGLAKGVMCLNKIVDVDLLNEIFELQPYNALRKPLQEVPPISGSSSASLVVNGTASDDLSADSANDRAKLRWSVAIAQVIRNSQQPMNESDHEDDSEESLSTPEVHSGRSSEGFSGISPSIIFASKRTSIFAEAISELPTRSLTPSGFNEDDDIDEEELAISEFNEKIKRKLSLKPPQSQLNAFTLELFSMDKKIDEQHGRDYLEAAFECFPDLEYCVMLLPSTHPFFPFLENFARVPLRFDKDFPMVLYVAHRATLLGLLQCREANSTDYEIIENFLRDNSKKNAVLKDFNAAMASENREKACYIFMCENRLIGLSIVCGEPHIDELRIMYNVEEYISLENTARDAHARLLHFILVPMFSTYHRFFFCELMRLSCTTAIYYRLYNSETMALNQTQSLVTCLDSMIHVKSRIAIHHPWPQRVEIEKNEDDRNFSLLLINPRLAMLPRRYINSKIVVVGASACGIAFAEFLALQSSSSDIVHFTNLTLVSPNGLPFQREETLEHATMIPFSGRYCYQYAKVVPSRVWINVVYGTVSHINRKDKYVTVFGLGNLTYDYLVLTCGLRYDCPKFHREEKDAEPQRSLQREIIPLNCFCINDDDDASTCLEILKELTNNFTDQKSIVIYGHNIQCYCTLNTLLKLGMPETWIVLIQSQLEPDEKRSDIFFENEEVDEAVANGIRDAGVKVLSGWNLKNWVIENTDVDGDELNQSNVIKSLKLQCKMEKKLIACDVLIFFGQKTIPMKTFMAISKAGLVFDGRLVINPKFETNDPHIFAAGTITKYSGKYHAEHLQHEYYNSIEIGERLASNLKQKIDFQPHDDEEKKLPDTKNFSQSLLPVFRAPIIVYCILPGGFHYLHIRKPGKRLPRAIHIATGTYGDVLETGSASTDSEIGYFRIRLNQFNRIETITCFSQKLNVLLFVSCFLILSTVVLIHHHQFYPIKTFRIQDLITLYGKHESMLNNLKIRFQNSLVSDLYAYFAEPWAAALFHDKFDCLRVENRATLLTKTGIFGGSLVDDILAAFIKSNWKEMSEEDRCYIESRFQGSVYQNAISSALISFLQAEEELLPKYCNPRKLRRQLMDEDD